MATIINVNEVSGGKRGIKRAKHKPLIAAPLDYHEDFYHRLNAHIYGPPNYCGSQRSRIFKPCSQA